MTNLFVVFDTKKNKVVRDGFGQDQKPEAKKIRDSLNVESKSKTRFVIRKGSDHINYSK